MTDVMLEEKFKIQCESVLNSRVDEVSRVIWNVEHVSNIRNVNSGIQG